MIQQINNDMIVDDNSQQQQLEHPPTYYQALPTTVADLPNNVNQNQQPAIDINIQQPPPYQ